MSAAAVGEEPTPAYGPRGTSSLDVSRKWPMRAEMKLSGNEPCS